MRDTQSTRDTVVSQMAFIEKTGQIMQFTEEDIYGQKHPIESTVNIPEKLAALCQEMDQLPNQDAVGWKQAKVKCPKLLDDDFLIMFLRCEVFNVSVSALTVCLTLSYPFWMLANPLTFSLLFLPARSFTSSKVLEQSNRSVWYGRSV